MALASPRVAEEVASVAGDDPDGEADSVSPIGDPRGFGIEHPESSDHEPDQQKDNGLGRKVHRA